MSRKTDALFLLERWRDEQLLQIKGLSKRYGLRGDAEAYYNAYDYAVCAIKLLTPKGESYVNQAVNPDGHFHREPIDGFHNEPKKGEEL